MNLWDRLPDERSGEYVAFTIFLELGPERNIANVQRAMAEMNSALLRKKAKDQGSTDQKDGKFISKRKYYEWRDKNDWLNRAAAYDLHTSSTTLAAIRAKQVDVSADELEVWATRRKIALDSVWFPLEYVINRMRYIHGLADCGVKQYSAEMIAEELGILASARAEFFRYQAIAIPNMETAVSAMPEGFNSMTTTEAEGIMATMARLKEAGEAT